MSNCLFEAAYEEILHRCNCTPSFHQTGIREYPWICTGTKLLCMKSILQRIGKYNVVNTIKWLTFNLKVEILSKKRIRKTLWRAAKNINFHSHLRNPIISKKYFLHQIMTWFKNDINYIRSFMPNYFWVTMEHKKCM